MTSYETIYERFLSKIQDYDFSQLEEEDQNEMLLNWLDVALSYIEFDGLITDTDLSDKDNDSEQFSNDLKGYEIEGIALYMVVAWYDPLINSLEHTLAFWGSKDEKFTNQKDHWKATKDTQELYRKRARRYFKNHSSRKNTYLIGDET